MLHLIRVRPDVREGGVEGDHDADAFTDQAREELLDLGDRVVEVQHARTHDVASAEREELLRERRGPVGRSGDRGDVGAQGVLRGQAAQQDRAMPDHDGEQVVEIVGDAAGQPAHHLHLVRLPQLRLRFVQGRLGPLALRDVYASGKATRPPVDLNHGHGHVQPPCLPILPDNRNLVVTRYVFATQTGLCLFNHGRSHVGP